MNAKKIPYLLTENSIDNFSNILNGVTIDLGCGRMPFRDKLLDRGLITEYIGVDLDYPRGTVYNDGQRPPDLTWDGISLPLPNESCDSVLSVCVLEHCPHPSVYLAEAYRIMRAGSPICVQVPFLWNIHDAPNDYWRATPFGLELLLKEAGFVDIRVTPTGGWHTALATMIGAYCDRAPLGKIQRRLVRALLRPFYEWATRRGRSEDVSDLSGLMITSLRAVAYKQHRQ